MLPPYMLPDMLPAMLLEEMLRSLPSPSSGVEALPEEEALWLGKILELPRMGRLLPPVDQEEPD